MVTNDSPVIGWMTSTDCGVNVWTLDVLEKLESAKLSWYVPGRVPVLEIGTKMPTFLGYVINDRM